MRPAHRRAPAWLQNDTSLVENIKHIHMVTKSTYILYSRPIRSSASTDGRTGALEEAGRAEQQITEAVSNELKLGRA